MTPLFHIGQTVRTKAFTDCFGVYQIESNPLTVTEIETITPRTMEPYYRIHATSNIGPTWLAVGAERAFETLEA